MHICKATGDLLDGTPDTCDHECGRADELARLRAELERVKQERDTFREAARGNFEWYKAFERAERAEAALAEAVALLREFPEPTRYAFDEPIWLREQVEPWLAKRDALFRAVEEK